MREAWIWTWGLRSLEKKECEEERLGVYLIDIDVRYIYKTLLSLLFFLFFFSLGRKQSIETKSNKQAKEDIYIYIFIMKLSILAAWLSAVGTAQAFWVRPFYFTLP